MQKSAIVLGPNASDFIRWAGGELQRYLRMLCGCEVPLVDAAPPGTYERPVVLSGPDATAHFAGLKPDAFVLRTIELDGRSALVAGGNTEAATMYAVYELLERLGIVFQLTGDMIPATVAELAVPNLDVRMEPAIQHRGLHMRHFVMPWMGMEYFRKFLGQLAKMKCNYLEFYWYVGAPWIEYSYRGEKKLIGDLYPNESGYATWRATAAAFGAKDVRIGREHFSHERVCALEFQGCETPEEAFRAARSLLQQVIRHAHTLKIQVWLGKGDCPGVPPNLGRHSLYAKRDPMTGPMMPAGDPAGVGIWDAALNSMAVTYPEADGYWLWLSEDYFHSPDPETKRMLAQYDRSLIPGLPEIRRLGYDRPTQPEQLESDVGLLHYAKQLTAGFRNRHPDKRLGIAVLGRSYLFRAMDRLLPRDVPFSSMESSGVWNRHSKVPMDLFGGMSGREMFLVPRLDDDESELAMQFNVTLYDRDAVLLGSVKSGVAGIAPQTGKTRGLEQNARFIAEGCWNASLKPEGFYQSYAARLFGKAAADAMRKAFLALEENEGYLGWRGFGNFLNYADMPEITLMGMFRSQQDPFGGPSAEIEKAALHFHAPEMLDKNGAEPIWLQANRKKHALFEGSVRLLEKALTFLDEAKPLVSLSSRREWHYIDSKTRQFIAHLESIRALLAGYIAYAEAFRFREQQDKESFLSALVRSETAFAEARSRAREIAAMIARLIDDPTEQYILFRYNVRYLAPIEEFSKFIGNVVNFYHGQPYWEDVDWDVISPPAVA